MIGFGRFILSDENNQWDLGILQWFVGTVIFLCMTVWSYGYKGQAWAPMDFGAGLLGVLGSGAALQWIRQKAPQNATTTVTKSSTSVDTVTKESDGKV